MRLEREMSLARRWSFRMLSLDVMIFVCLVWATQRIVGFEACKKAEETCSANHDDYSGFIGRYTFPTTPIKTIECRSEEAIAEMKQGVSRLMIYWIIQTSHHRMHHCDIGVWKGLACLQSRPSRMKSARRFGGDECFGKMSVLVDVHCSEYELNIWDRLHKVLNHTLLVQ